MASTDTLRRTFHFLRFGNAENRKAVYGAPEFNGMNRYAIVENLACVVVSPACSLIERSRALEALCQCGDVPEVVRALVSFTDDLLTEWSPRKKSLDMKKGGFEPIISIIYDAVFQNISRRILGALPPPDAPP